MSENPRRANIFQVIKKSGESTIFDEMKLQTSIEGALTETGIEKNPIAAQLVDDVIKKIEEELSYRENISTLDIREAVEISLLERGLTSVVGKYHDFDNLDLEMNKGLDQIDTNQSEPEVTIAEIIDKKKFIPVEPGLTNSDTDESNEFLPDERSSITYKLNFSGVNGYLTVSLFDNGRPGEVLLHSIKTSDDVNLGIVNLFLTIINTSLKNKVSFDILISDIMLALADSESDNEMSVELLRHICEWLNDRF